MNINAKVAQDKENHPERFCPTRRCLWRTAKLNWATGQHEGGGYCPRHGGAPRPESVVVPVGYHNKNGFHIPQYAIVAGDKVED